MVVGRTHAILVWDERGEVFAALRRTGLSLPLWRVSQAPANGDLEAVDLAIAALHRPSDWGVVAKLARRVPTVIVAASPDPRDASRALSLGAFGYLDPGLSTRALRRAVSGALHGEPAYSRTVLGGWIRSEIGSSSRSSAVLALTARQREVVDLIATGASDKEIASALGIATATAQKHVARLLHRLRVPNRAAAVAATRAVQAL